jgi:hypothetical protein
VQGHDKVTAVLARFEAVEWRYDGLHGKAIKWTNERGNTHPDPSVLAFVVTPDERLVAMAPGRSVYAASSFAKWLREQSDAYERAHPRTKVPFVRATVETTGGEPRCDEMTKAREAGKPIVLLFGREGRPDDDRSAKAEVKATRAFVKKQLGSKQAAENAKGWTLLRFDLADAGHASFAKKLGVSQAPATLMIVPGEKDPIDLTTKLRSGSLAYWLKKHGPPRR